MVDEQAQVSAIAATSRSMVIILAGVADYARLALAAARTALAWVAEI